MRLCSYHLNQASGPNHVTTHGIQQVYYVDVNLGLHKTWQDILNVNIWVNKCRELVNYCHLDTGCRTQHLHYNITELLHFLMPLM